jgi:hypothetical protein
MLEERQTDVIAASRVGKVENEDVWILSAQCQINEDGQLVKPEDRKIEWISHLYKPKRGGQDPVWSDIAKPAHECCIALPLSGDGLKHLVCAIRNAFGGNWRSAVFLLGIN